FAVGTASDETTLGNAPGKVLSFTNAGGFTGILLGVYAHGDGVVDFNEVHYQAGSGVADE
ncbi:MAG: glycoside hydrolase family 43 protein, partial [Bifidobacterium dentium]